MMQDKSARDKINPEKQAKPKNKARRDKRKPKIPKKITERYLYNSGLYYLQRFSASRNHFLTVMERKIRRSCHHHTSQNYDECVQMAEKIATQFEELGYINDELYTRGMVTSLRRQGKSTRFILSKLRQKGLSEDQVRPALEDYDTTVQNRDTGCDHIPPDLRAAVQHMRKKKLGPFNTKTLASEEEHYKHHEKSLGNMARAGFGFDTAKTALSKTREEALDIIDRS
jgi:regulatory protein